MYILDRLVPTALVCLLDALGSPSSDRVRLLSSILDNQIRCAFHVEELHKLHAVCLRQHVGILFQGVRCEKMTKLYHAQRVRQGPAASTAWEASALPMWSGTCSTTAPRLPKSVCARVWLL